MKKLRKISAGDRVLHKGKLVLVVKVISAAYDDGGKPFLLGCREHHGKPLFRSPIYIGDDYEIVYGEGLGKRDRMTFAELTKRHFSTASITDD